MINIFKYTGKFNPEIKGELFFAKECPICKQPTIENWCSKCCKKVEE